MSASIASKPYLNWRDVAAIFDCGRSKAMLLMHAVGVVYIGHEAFVRADDLEEHLEKNGSIDISWPQSTTRRKEAHRARR